MRRLLDSIYIVSGAMAATLIAGIVVLIAAQIGLNLTARIMGPGWSWTIPSYADFAGFMLANASFLALGATFRAGGHIRVSLVTTRLPRRVQWLAEVAVLMLGLAVIGYALFYLINLVGESYRYGDMSSGIVPIPLWVPQAGMTAGVAVLCIALADTLVGTIRAKAPILPESAEA